LATFSNSFQVFPISFIFITLSMFLLNVSLGLPWLRFPSAGVHLRAIFVMEFYSLLITWPSQLNCFCMMVVMIHCWPVLSKRSLLDILLAQYILQFFLRHTGCVSVIIWRAEQEYNKHNKWYANN
jgi:hypothetical protein